MAKLDPTDDPKPTDPGTAEATPPNGTDSPPEESGLAAGLRRFSRRLATFGLGEAQKPLLTEEIWSVDSKGNPR